MWPACVIHQASYQCAYKNHLPQQPCSPKPRPMTMMRQSGAPALPACWRRGAVLSSRHPHATSRQGPVHEEEGESEGQIARLLKWQGNRKLIHRGALQHAKVGKGSHFKHVRADRAERAGRGRGKDSIHIVYIYRRVHRHVYIYTSVHLYMYIQLSKIHRRNKQVVVFFPHFS